MDGLSAEGYDRTYGDLQLLRRILGYFRPFWPTTLIVSGAIFGTSVLDAALPVLERDMSFCDEYATGRIVSRVTSDTQDFSTVVTLTLNLLSQLLQVAIIAGVLYVNPRLALVAFAIASFIVALALAFRRIARHTTQQARRVLADVNANVQESIAGISVAKAFRQEAAVYRQFREVNARSYWSNLRQGLVFSAIFPLLGTIAGVGTALVIYAGGNSVLAGIATPGQWFLFVEAVAMFWFPLTSISSFWSRFQLGLSASERVLALIDADPRVRQRGAQRPGRLRGRIDFRDVDFRYSEQEWVLRGFSLAIEVGETVALAGHSGAGTSSLGKLIARFYGGSTPALAREAAASRWGNASWWRSPGCSCRIPPSSSWTRPPPASTR